MSGIQWTIDMERKLARNPMSSCINIYSKMWDSMVGKGGLSEKMNSFVAYVDSPDLYIKEDAKDEHIDAGKVISYR